MGHGVSRPQVLATMEMTTPRTRGLHFAMLVTVLTAVAASSAQEPCNRSSHAHRSLLSHSSRRGIHHDHDRVSSRIPSCFVGAAPLSSSTREYACQSRGLGGTKLSASAALSSNLLDGLGFFSPRTNPRRSSTFQDKSKDRQSTPGKIWDQKDSERGSPSSSKLSGSRLSLDYGSSSRWEPLRVRDYNAAARRKKRQQHLLKIVRHNRNDKGSPKLHYKDEGVLQNDLSTPSDDPLIAADFSKAQTHQALRHKKKCLVLRKDRRGKIRTFWTKVPHGDDGSTDSSSFEASEDLLDLTVCSPKDHECASVFGNDVEEAELPKPSMRKSEAEMYAATDVSTLRKIFGRNKNKLWGDLDPETTRILYHTLLPRALLRLHAQGLTPDELAPLAYEARCAAKQYARERSQVPGRVASMAFDGVRHVKTYGKWSTKGLSWDQIWEKYEQQVLKDVMESLEDDDDHGVVATANVKELTTQVCKKILERSCSTNEMVDRVVMKRGSDGKRRSSTAQEVLAIANRFDQEIHELLNNKEKEKEVSMKAKEFMLRRKAANIRKKLSGLPFSFSQWEG